MTTGTVIPQNREVVYETRLIVIECANCAVDFGIGADFQRHRRNDHGTFYCPNGHSNYYPGPSALEKKAERLERERDAARSLAERESRRRVVAERDAHSAELRRRAAKGQLTKTKKRIAAGVCPCCNRTFQNVARHIAGQHPDYVEQEHS